jgi:predicted nuclease of restriction endonuclease-like (RecB) superfamily
MEKENNLSALGEAVAAIKQAILRSQYNVAQTANRELLSLYFGIGKYISHNTREGAWGTGAIETISEQLHKELPGLRGFSASGLKKMRIFYEQWQMLENRSLAVNEIENGSKGIETLSLINRSLAVNDLNMHDFLAVSFTHHYELLAKVDDLEERIFYIRKAAENHWNKDRMIDEIKADLYHHQSAMPNNFTQSMPDKVSALKSISMFKDNYLLDFVNMEELNAREKDVDERVLEQQIVQNVKDFIMTFGRDFTFVGNQYHLEKFGEEQFPDLLFYNRELMALVVVELKMGEFKPAYLGQLSAYLRILDSEVKKPHENPSIGIVLCKKANKSFVEFLIQGYDNPMGVATYKTADEVKKLLPSEDELRNILDETDEQ